MEIYVQVCSGDDGSSAWYNKTNREAYLMDGKELWCFDSQYGDYERGTPFKTIAAAKLAAKEAKNLATWDGMVDVKVNFWKYVNGDLVRVKFTRDNKIKK